MISKERFDGLVINLAHSIDGFDWDRGIAVVTEGGILKFAHALLKAVEAESTPVALLPIGCDITPSIKSTCGVNCITKREAKEYHPSSVLKLIALPLVSSKE